MSHLHTRAERRLHYLELVREVDRSIVQMTDAGQLLEQVVALIQTGFCDAAARVLLVDEQAGNLVLRGAAGPGAEALGPLGARFAIDENVAGRAVATGQALLGEGAVAAPILAGERVLGVLELRRPGAAFDAEDLLVLEILSSRIGTALAHKALFEETHRRYTTMVAVHETSLDIVAQLDRQPLLESLLRRGAALLDSSDAAVYLCDEARENLVVAAISPFAKEILGVRYPMTRSLSAQAVLTGTPQFWDGCTPYPDQPEPFRNRPPVRAVIVPLRWREEIFGALGVYRDMDYPAFSMQDAWVLSVFADLASIAIKNAELFEQVRELSRDLERRIEQRTAELVRAKRALAINADQLRSLLQKTMTVQEEERARISRDLHDGVVQLITAARYELKAALITGGAAVPEATVQKLGAAREILDELERELRNVIYDLQPPLLGLLGLVPALERYTGMIHKMTGIECSLECIGTATPLPPAIELGIFRIVEQALHNITVHAQATRASVTLVYQGRSLRVSIRDDGQGFDYDAWLKQNDGTHLGLLGMQERARAMGGNLKVWANRGKGTHLLFEVPIETRAPAGEALEPCAGDEVDAAPPALGQA